MNCTNQNSEIPPLKARCNRMGIHVPGDNPTPAEIIPIIEQRLAAHQKHRSKNANPWTGDFAEWKNIHDAYTEFLVDLRAAEKAQATKDFSTERSGQNSEPTPTQPNPEWPESGQHWPDSGQDLPHTGQAWPDAGQPLPNAGQPSPSHSTSSTESTKSTEPDDIDDDDDQDSLDDDDENEENENLEDVEDLEEADIEAELAGYASDAERMAEAAADLQAHRKKRNRFDTLSEEDQAGIIALLDIHDSRTVVRLIARPTPHGLNFKISKSGLNYFVRRYKKRQEQLRADKNYQASADLLDKSDNPHQAFQNAIERLLRLRLLTTSSEPDAPLETIDTLNTILIKLRKQTLAERKQLHAEKPK